MNSLSEDVDRVLRWVFSAVIIVSLIGIVFFALTPQATTDPITELYVLGPDGNASDYPTDLEVDQRGEVIVGVANSEHRETTYTVVVRLGNETVDTRTFTLGDGETWEEPVTFGPESAGKKRLEILLFYGDEYDLSDEPYRRIWLHVTVTQ